MWRIEQSNCISHFPRNIPMEWSLSFSSFSVFLMAIVLYLNNLLWIWIQKYKGVQYHIRQYDCVKAIVLGPIWVIDNILLKSPKRAKIPLQLLTCGSIPSTITSFSNCPDTLYQFFISSHESWHVMHSSNCDTFALSNASSCLKSFSAYHRLLFAQVILVLSFAA